MSHANQLTLELRESPGWGGRRPGAGRKPAPDARILHRSREGFGPRHPCHVTVKTRPDVPSLRSVRLVRELEGSFEQPLLWQQPRRYEVGLRYAF